MDDSVKKPTSRYNSGEYWRRRKNMFYYRYVRFVVEQLGKDAKSILDVGSGNSPYIEWFDWIPEMVSIDIRAPYSSDKVKAIVGNIQTHKFEKRFDICMCLQVLEHVREPTSFARRLLDLGRLLIVSVPYKWTTPTTGHVNDPVTREKMGMWFGREPNLDFVAVEPFLGEPCRLISIYDPADPERKFGHHFGSIDPG